MISWTSCLLCMHQNEMKYVLNNNQHNWSNLHASNYFRFTRSCRAIIATRTHKVKCFCRIKSTSDSISDNMLQITTNRRWIYAWELLYSIVIFNLSNWTWRVAVWNGNTLMGIEIEQKRKRDTISRWLIKSHNSKSPNSKSV